VARRKSRTLTEVELEFMQVVWAAGGVTTEDVQNALRKQGRNLTDGSVRKMLSILTTKGYLTRSKDGRGFVYEAAVPADKANRRMVVDLLRRAFGGSAALMVATLLDSSDVSDKDVEEIKKLIADRE
jgi:BlaI family penicillinase repressor